MIVAERSAHMASTPQAADDSATITLRVERLAAWYGNHQVLRNVDLDIAAGKVTAIIGPSGCGKSTLIRCLNRLHETTPGARVAGRVLLQGEDIYAADADPVLVRRRVGMVFQHANPFPTLSIFDNVAAGLRLNGLARGEELKSVVEESLRQAALWDEVKDQLPQRGIALSGGQQQRLCIARALAVQPDVLLLDEPTGALDPTATLRIEELLRELKLRYTIVIVTHNMQQAARVSDATAFLLAGDDRVGELVEVGPTGQLFTKPHDPRTEAYIEGRFG
jgi:phosphate transport system ATP-binding protein